MCLEINPLIRWKKKKSCLVVYRDFNFYFFKGTAKRWLECLLQRKGGKSIPEDFIEYLKKCGILIQTKK
jgi:hypothetical protein